MIMIIIIINTISSYIHMRLGNCLDSCDRYLKCHSAQAVSYKASRKLGNLTDYRVTGSNAFNTLRRDSLLDAVARENHRAIPICSRSLLEPSVATLRLEDHTLRRGNTARRLFGPSGVLSCVTTGSSKAAIEFTNWILGRHDIGWQQRDSGRRRSTT